MAFVIFSTGLMYELAFARFTSNSSKVVHKKNLITDELFGY